ncbi:MAG: glycosyltransferase, partial [Defluviitaleaceae bacterium]|nr:glycosyltransferase [Defluviitaleaceae bacterium]
MKIILTGGGTAGHVVPNLALVPELLEAGFEIHYIGGKGSMEQGLAEGAGLVYHGVSTGKLRRYLSLKNFTDAFRVVKGINDARKILKKIKPDVIFSKGGFVVVPVVYAAKMAKIPVIIHESDITVGLANKLAIPHAKKVCYVFPEALAGLPADKAVRTGTPLRKEILNGSALKGAEMCGFSDDKPVLMVMGGSSGSA